ncbi:MAG: hypothetical protein QMC77_07100 [Methanocellales archaeon]|nr:hypothetical protein [Methanocellales archaeon]
MVLMVLDVTEIIQKVGVGEDVEEKTRYILREAIYHELEHIDAKIREFETKYGMSLQRFEEADEKQIGLDPLSYEAERDYFEWEGLVSRKNYLLKYLKGL